jgi:hypothetical protein
LEWENFTVQYGEQWVDEYMALQKTDEHYYGPIYEPGTYNVSDSIHGDFGELPYNITDRVFLPTWHSYPVVPRYNPYNYDFLSNSFPDVVITAMEERAVAVSEPYHLPDPNDPVGTYSIVD